MSSDAEPISKLVDDVPEEFERIVSKAMSYELDDRYATVNELLEDLNRLAQQQLINRDMVREEHPDVVPVRSVSEVSSERYSLRRRRSGRVAFMSGVLGGLVVVVLLFVFLWDFWLGEVFSPAQRISLPNFIGSNYDTLANNVDLVSMYDFKVTYIIDTESESGLILSQNPDPGRSMMITPEGIKVDLTVSTGVILTAVPDVINKDYREAMLTLSEAGFETEVENQTSASVTKDFVISTSPAVNEKISAGSTVYLVVSSGPEVSYISMPNLIGLSEDAAINKLENSGLSYGGSERVTSEYDAGTVIGQNISAFTEVEEHSKVHLRVSTGPWG